MNRIKTAICILSAAAVIIGCFAGCAKRPEEKATTGTTVYEVIKQDGELSTDADDETPDAYVATSNNVVFTISSYNVFNDNYAKIKNITTDTDSNTANASCYCDLEMIYIGNDSNKMRISYKAYDADGNLVRDAYLQADLSDVKSGDTITKVRFDIPYDTTKVVFSDFTGGQDENA